MYLHRYKYYIVKLEIKENEIDIIEFKEHKLFSYFASNIKVLREMSYVISVAKHSVNIGTARENIIESFLKRIMPVNIGFYTGEIINHDDESSGQLDIIMQHKNLPKFNLFGNIDLFPVETVLGVIEVKSNLYKVDIQNALKSYEKIKQLNNDINIEFIIIGFNSLEFDTIISHIKEINDNSNIEYHNISVISLDMKKLYYIGIDNNIIENQIKCSDDVYFKLFEKLMNLANEVKEERFQEFNFNVYYPKLKSKSELAFLDLF